MGCDAMRLIHNLCPCRQSDYIFEHANTYNISVSSVKICGESQQLWSRLKSMLRATCGLAKRNCGLAVKISRFPLKLRLAPTAIA